MTTCAVVRLADGLVTNKIVAEPTDMAPNDCQLISIDGIACDIGWTWNGTQFVSPTTQE